MQQPRKPPGRPFQKGQSGNPGGRPKADVAVQELARKYTVQAIETLADLMQHSEVDRVRVAAAEALLDRGWGRPAQPVDVTWDLSRYTPEQLPTVTAHADEILARVAAGESPDAVVASFAGAAVN